MVTASTYTENFLISKKIPVNSSQIIPLWDNSTFQLDPKLASYKVVANNFVKNFKVYVNISSLDAAEVPEELYTDPLISPFRTSVLIRQLQWQEQRFHLELLIQESQTLNSEWSPRGEVSLVSRDDLPYYDNDLMAYFSEALAIELSGDSRIGVKIKDVGFGLLGASDTVIVYGNLIKEISIVDTIESNGATGVIPVAPIYNDYSWSVSTTSQVLLEGIEREHFTLVNIGSYDAYMNFGSEAEIGKGICLLSNGGSFDWSIKTYPLYNGPISVISNGTTTLTGVQGVTAI